MHGTLVSATNIGVIALSSRPVWQDDFRPWLTSRACSRSKVCTCVNLPGKYEMERHMSGKFGNIQVSYSKGWALGLNWSGRKEEYFLQILAPIRKSDFWDGILLFRKKTRRSLESSVTEAKGQGRRHTGNMTRRHWSKCESMDGIYEWKLLLALQEEKRTKYCPIVPELTSEKCSRLW